MRQARTLLPSRKLFALSLLATALPALAAELQAGDDVKVKLDTTLSLGTTIRTAAPNPAEYAYIPSTTVSGAAPGLLTGQTGGSDLNFKKNRAVSTIGQGMFDLTVQSGHIGLFARAALWNDFNLGTQLAAYGNYPNGYVPNTPLSDQGFQQGAKFSDGMMRDVYVFGTVDLGEQRKLDLKFGRQVLDWNGNQSILSGNWGGARMIAGGINSAINPSDFAAQLRPGAITEEARVPVGMLSLHLVSGKQWGADAFLPYESREAVLPGCGTFFDVVSVIPPGCNLGSAIPFPIPVPGSPVATVASLTERSLLTSGQYLRRLPDETPSGGGQFGLAGHYVFEAAHTEVSAYAMNTATTMPYFQVKMPSVLWPTGISITAPAALAPYGAYYSAFERLNPYAAYVPPGVVTNPAFAPLAAGTGNGLDYGIVYPKSVHLFGLSFNTELSAATRFFGEVAYRPNQPLSYNLNDVLNATLLGAPNSLLNEQRSVLTVPAGGLLQAYDRKPITTASAGFNQVFLKALGAARIQLSGEVGLSHIGDLPNPNVMRYGRAFAYGSAPYLDSKTGAMSATTAACETGQVGLKYAPGTCTTDGFMTTTSWGWRLAAAAVYPNAILGATLMPSLTLADDVHGYSYDGSFSQGRMAVRPALHAGWARGYYADIAYTHMSGGHYNLMADRSNLMLSAGVKF
ncbi:MAG: DUF1302 family protein [Paucibacter sp.]|nr:DUF1302 family protein [Roseateles sp.]